jgi:hypothetical protein
MKTLLGALILAAGTLQDPKPSPTSSPSPSPSVPPGTSLQADIEKAVDEAIDKGLLRFETSVEVEGRTPQQALEALLRGFDLECGTTDRGAPTDADTRAQMRSVRPTTPYTVDFIPFLAALQKKMSARGGSRYYIYRVKKADGDSYRLRDSAMPMNQIYNTPGAHFELVAQVADLKEATDVFWRLERGLSVKSANSSQPNPWLNWNCRPR